MRVWIVNSGADRSGGAEVYAENLAVGLAARGHDVTIACYDAAPHVEAVARILRIPRPNHASRPLLWHLAPALVGRHWSWHMNRVSGRSPDVVVMSPSVCGPAFERRFPDAPIVYLPHARIAPVEVAGSAAATPSKLYRHLAYRTHYRAERRTLLRSATTVRFTPGAADLLRRFYRLPERVRFDVIPQAVNVPATIAAPRTGPLRIVAVGRLIESKYLELLVAALVPLHKMDWHLDVVGDGPERANLQATVASCDLVPRVTFHLQQDDPARFYAAADLLAFPSRLENVSLVVLEAMAHGVTPLVIRADGVRYQNVHHEVIRDGVDGIIAADEADFAARLRECIREPAIARRLSGAARATGLKHSWTAALDRWEGLLAELAARRNA